MWEYIKSLNIYNYNSNSCFIQPHDQLEISDRKTVYQEPQYSPEPWLGVQQRMQANRQRIQQIEAEIQGLEGSIATDALDPASRSSAPAQFQPAVASAASLWLPVTFSSHLRLQDKATVQAFGAPWVVFWGADRKLACLRDTCAHRACPLSLVGCCA